MTMPEIDMGALGEELSAGLRAAMAHTPFPQDGSPAQAALKELAQANQLAATIAIPQVLAAATQWAQSIQALAMAFMVLGIKIDLKPSPQTAFHKNLFGKGDGNDD
jgi:hypothetical protein